MDRSKELQSQGAIANNPKILLCDEATSALDPQTTKSVLELLKQINRDYGITIVVVTHEMSVVQEICNQVAILNEGNVVETGSVSEIFTAPKSPEAKSLIIGSGSHRKRDAWKTLYPNCVQGEFLL